MWTHLSETVCRQWNNMKYPYEIPNNIKYPVHWQIWCAVVDGLQMLLLLEWDLALDMQSMIFSYLSLGITITCTTFFDMDCKDFMLICYTATVLRSALFHHLCYGLHFSAAAECFEHVELWMKVMVFPTACVWYWGVVFCHSRIPKMGGKDLDLHVLYIEVTQRGGLHQVLPLRSLWPVQFPHIHVLCFSFCHTS